MLNLNSSPKREFPECLLDIMYYSSNLHTIYYDWSHHHLLFINLSQTPILQNLVNSVCLTISLEFLGGTSLNWTPHCWWLISWSWVNSFFFTLHLTSRSGHLCWTVTQFPHFLKYHLTQGWGNGRFPPCLSQKSSNFSTHLQYFGGLVESIFFYITLGVMYKNLCDVQEFRCGSWKSAFLTSSCIMLNCWSLVRESLFENNLFRVI